MKSKVVSGILLTLLFLDMLTLVFNVPQVKTEPATITVPDDYPTIQEAINHVNEGDTINVKAGTYLENVLVNKSVKLVGESRETTIIDGVHYVQYKPGVVEIIVNNVTITGFTITGGEEDWMSGIYIHDSSDNIISGNNIVSPGQYGDGGILVKNSFNNVICGNKIASCYDYSLSLVFSDNNIISGNNMTSNRHDGLVLGASSNNFISGNNITGMYFGSGIQIDLSSNNIIRGNYINTVGVDSEGIWLRSEAYDNIIFGNTITNSAHGLSISSSCKNNSVSRNNITNNIATGIGVGGAYNSIYGNNITNNGLGIRLVGAYNSIYGNNITANNGGGISCDSSNNSIHHNNFVNNTKQVYDSPDATNVWDDGYPSGGNYWSNYTGVDLYGGPYQNETGSDGVGDTPHIIDEANRDNYPLMSPSPQPQLFPVSYFVYAPYAPIVTETVTFNASSSCDFDGSILSYAWDFGDGTFETEQIITHVYSKAGVYNVTLTVTDNDGLMDTSTRSVNVGKLNSSISILVSPTTITIGEGTTISGSITPAREGVNVTIWYKFGGQEDWVNLTAVSTDDNSEYSYDWTPPDPAIYELKANWTGDDSTFPAETSSTLICEKISTSVSISTSAPSTFVGFRVNITGCLQDMYGNGLEDETVVFYYTFSGIIEWVPITSDTTDNLGHYFAMWIPPATGYFVLKAEWAGNATHFGTSNTTTLSSIVYQDQYVFSVESNSTISELAFDTKNWKLSFTTTGPNGTIGYVKVTVAKSLIADIANIRVYMDGRQSNFSITSINDSWFLAFNYMHSTHQIVMDLDIDIIPEFSSFLIILLFMITTLLAVIVYRRKNST